MGSEVIQWTWAAAISIDLPNLSSNVDLTLEQPSDVKERLSIRNLALGIKPFQDGGRYDIETSPLICTPNQWTGFYMITASVLKGSKALSGRRTCSQV